MSEPSSNCPDAELLANWFEGRVEIATANALSEHVEHCESCRDAVERLECAGGGIGEMLRTAVRRNHVSATLNNESHSDMDIWPIVPKRIRDYEILEPIGRGGMGQVFHAFHCELGKHVAIKLLTLGRINNQESIARFQREMLALGSLEHPNIVFATDAGHEGDCHFIVMELVSGRNLRQLLNSNGSFSVSNACEITRQVALALSYAHEQGMLHRDVKPSNVMVTDRGVVKLLDLGLARVHLDANDNDLEKELTLSGQVLGTVDYISPEQADGHRPIDHRSDIYSLGVTLFKLLTGRVPFAEPEHQSVARKLAAVMQDAAPSIAKTRPELPKDLCELVDSMLANDAAIRPDTAISIANQISRFCDGADLPELVRGCDSSTSSSEHATVTMEPQNEATSSRPSSSQNRYRTFGFIALGAVIIIAFAWQMVISRPRVERLASLTPDGSTIGEQETRTDGIQQIDMLRHPFASAPIPLNKSEGFDVALADFNGDSLMDAFFANGGLVGRYANRLWLGNSNMRGDIQEAKLGASGSMAVALGDLDSDGDIDAIVANALDSDQRKASSRVWLNDGDANFSRTPQFLLTPMAFAVRLGDVDHDGDLDACICQRDDGQDGIWMNDGKGYFERVQDLETQGSTVDIDFGDVDGDGDLDLLATDIAEDQPNQIFVNDGHGQFEYHGQQLGFGTYRRGRLVDMDRDGDLDAVFILRLEGEGEIWMNDGQGVFTLQTTFPGGDYRGLATGDVNMDGWIDIVVAAGSADVPTPNLVFLNAQGTGFTAPFELPFYDPSTNVALGDVDNDGDLDLFVTNRQSENLLWINNCIAP